MVNRFQITRACITLNEGGIIAYPTETVYGLGCDPRCHRALKRLLSIKRRAWQKGLILIAASVNQLREYIEPLDPAMMTPILATWPGPVTWLLPARSDCSPMLRGTHATLAVRVTSHPATQVLCQRFRGAIVSTSANLSGHPPARDFLAVQKHFHGVVDYIVPGTSGPRTKPSEIRDGLSGRIVRHG